MRLAFYLAYGIVVSVGWRLAMKLNGPLAGEGRD